MAPDVGVFVDLGPAPAAPVDLADADGLTPAPKRNRRKRSRTQSVVNGVGRRPASSFMTVSVAPDGGIQFGGSRVRHWFKARNGCTKRWQRAASPPNRPVVAQKVVILRYTDDEYENLCVNESWSKKDTDHMLDLAELFDRRFIVIADRIQPPRTVEEIKQRFYDIQTAIARYRNLNPEGFSPSPESYDADQEKTRREQLELLLKRTPEEERNIAQLVLKHHRLEQTIRSRKQELSEARRLIKVQEAISKMSNAVTEGVVKRRSTRPPTEEEQRQNPFSGLPDHVVIGNAFPSRPPGVFLRHQQLLTMPTLVNQKLQKQLETELEEAGLTVQQLPTPTDVVCEMYDRLRQDYLTLFNLQRYVARKEQDTLQLKQELQAAQKAAGITPNSMSKSKKKPVPGNASSKKVIASKAPASRKLAASTSAVPTNSIAAEPSAPPVAPTTPMDTR